MRLRSSLWPKVSLPNRGGTDPTWSLNLSPSRCKSQRYMVVTNLEVMMVMVSSASSN